MGSLGGAFLGGILVGVIEEVAASIIGAQFRDLIVFAFLVFILIIRPQGLFGKKVSA
jgi:branched-chain amino acid transport system permease protein